ncbi:MAG: carbon starvation protein A [Endomicrobia bacterium]|nr:carbon starvation protein A [Endomicrobiia bacterium]
MILYILVILFILIFAYFSYGKFIEQNFNIESSEEVPSKKYYDGVDFVPTNKFILLGHHFSSIAGAGPIVGPILAGMSFGWLPAVLWILLGSIFIGGLHDFSSLVISVRHEGKTIAEIANKYVNKTTYKLFLIFIWLALMYVVAVFADLAATSFSSDASVAEISLLYILIAIIFGVVVYKLNLKILPATIVSLVLIVFGILISIKYPILLLPKQTWVWILLFYSFLASILPVWFLLQPRDYLSSYFLYFTVIIGLFGLLFGKYEIVYPSFISFSSKSIGPLVPFMFITIACGAISGFHSLVSSGTTSKQLDNIKNARFVSYGGMLLEGIVAAIALSTLMILSKDTSFNNPQQVYALGIAKFCNLIGIKESVGRTIGFLAISAFILTTLDTATRIARYVFQELIGKSTYSVSGRIIATLISLILPIVILNLKLKDFTGNIVPCWKIIWPVFGITNQLLAGLVLLVIYLWFRRENFKYSTTVVLPMLFMLTMTLSALFYTVYKKIVKACFDVITITAGMLLIVGVFIVIEVIKSIANREKN